MRIARSVPIKFTLVLMLFGAVLASATENNQQYPNVLKVNATQRSSSWTISATLSSPYDSPRRYADAFRVLTLEGEELGVRVLLHDHASEQPFTRSLSGLAIPENIDTVIIQGRDQTYGWGGQVVQLELKTGQQIMLPNWP